MNVQAEFYPLYVPEEEKREVHVWGVANVVVNGIRIPNIRAVNYPKENGEWGHFFAYPQIKVGDDFQDGVRLNKEQKKEIEEAIQKKIKENLLEQPPDIQIASLSVMEKKEALVAVASVIVNQIQIDHVCLFQKGGNYFVKMPQYMKEGKWKPLIQLENQHFVMPEIERRVEEAYEERMRQLQENMVHQKQEEKRERKMAKGRTVC